MAKRMTEFYQKEVTGQFTGPIKIGSSAEYITMEDTDSAETLKDFSGRVGDPSNLYNNVDKEKDQQKDLVTTVNELTAAVAAGAKIQDKSIQQSKLKDIKIVDSTASYPAITDGPLGNILGKIKKFLNDLKNNKVSRTGDTMSGDLLIKQTKENTNSRLLVQGMTNNGASVLGALISRNNGDFGIYDFTNNKWLILNESAQKGAKTRVPNLVFDNQIGILGKMGDPEVERQESEGKIGIKYTDAIANANIKYCFVKRLGRAIFVTMSIAYTTTDGTIPTGTTLFTIPKGYSPSSTQRLPAFFGFKGSTTPHSAIVSITPEGAVQQSHSSSTNSIYCFGMWERQ